MKTLQERMNDMKPYFRGIEMYNEAIMVKVAYPNKWNYYPSKNEKIKITTADNNKGLLYYYANSNDTTYEEIFDLIEETIKTNEDIVLKLKLLKDKIEELKEIFSTSSYEKLLTLTFDFKKKKRNKKIKETIIEPNQNVEKEVVEKNE